MVANARAPELLRLACTNCGAPLQISPDEATSRCPHCNSQHLIARTASGISLKPVLKRLDNVQKIVSDGARASMRAADELTLVRIVKDRAEAEVQGARGLKEAETIRRGANNNLIIAFFSFLAVGVLGLVGGFGVVSLITGDTRDLGAAGGLLVAVLALAFGIVLVQSSSRMNADADKREQEIKKNSEGWRVYEQELRKRLST
jgi:DNA-directed RNA polymerase subunit RPC12/RpoP